MRGTKASAEKSRIAAKMRMLNPVRWESISGFGRRSLLALGARADGAEIVVGVDAGGVAVRETDLDGVVPYLRGGPAAGFGLEHRERGR